jgi:hypothetical protein
MSSQTGNIRGQRTQSSCNGYKTLGSSIASGNNGGCFKRVFINALENTNNNYELAFTKTLGIPKNYYNNTSNSSKYQQPTLSGKRLAVITNSTAVNLTPVYQTATVGSTYPSSTVSTFAINNGAYTINGYIYTNNESYYAYLDYPINYYIPVNIYGTYFSVNVEPQQKLNSGQYGTYEGGANAYGSNGYNGYINLDLSLYNGGPYVSFSGNIYQQT